MHTALRFRKAVGILTGKNQRRALNARRFARQHVGDIHPPAPRLSPALVHAQEHVRPIARFGTAGPGVDAHDAITLIMGAVEKDLQLKRIEVLEELAQVLFEFLLDLRLGGFRLGLAQFDHHMKILDLLLRFEERFGLVAEGIGFVNELLGLLAAVPEGLRRHQGVDFPQAFLRARYVKETSADGPVYP